ncbi:PepSY domain-containing protein [Reichenbachiella agarivorans]|uniref:PepSY domain-containing protein n=1 Tax=Reichenbachiella agarivorans TaxID=2979464 RepID=A0ABY6CKV1_9BACT|nr:PepSY domain-containing protein [Reichenbachiella agarivorans]UXP31142.1 PepSY domain-containing protein [Reichenbachiella agarivorans]
MASHQWCTADAPGMSTSIVAFPRTVFTSKHHYAVFVKGQTPLTERLVKPALIEQNWRVGRILWTVFDLITIVVLISGLYLWVAVEKHNQLKSRDLRS